MKHFGLDFDNNILDLDTKIVLFAKNDSPIDKIAVSTDYFAEYRLMEDKNKEEYVKKIKGIYTVVSQKTKTKINIQDYEVVLKNEASFYQFRDCSEKFFQQHLLEAIKKKSYAPSWKDFLEATDTEENAKRSYIITARGHSPQTIYTGFKLLKEMGLIKNLIPRKNIYPISHDKFKGSSSSPEEVKKQVITDILNKIDQEANDLVTFGFSDDDEKTINHINEFIRTHKQKGKWENVKINIYLTKDKKEIVNHRDNMKYIIMEGMDGTGKSKLSKELAKIRKAEYTYQPLGKGEKKLNTFTQLRNLILDDKYQNDITPMARELLLMANRSCSASIVHKALEHSDLISDRSIISGKVFASVIDQYKKEGCSNLDFLKDKDTMSLKLWKQLAKEVNKEFPNPDVIVHVVTKKQNIDVVKGDIYDNAPKDFHEKISKQFKKDIKYFKGVPVIEFENEMIDLSNVPKEDHEKVIKKSIKENAQRLNELINNL